MVTKIGNINTYKVNPAMASKWPPSDSISAQLQTAISEMKGDLDTKKRAFTVGNWFIRNFVPYINFLNKQIPAQVLTLGEVKEGIKGSFFELDPKPDFDINRFGKEDKILTEHHLGYIQNAVNEEILMPNRIVVSEPIDKKKLVVGLILDEPEYFISYCGRMVPAYTTTPLPGDYIEEQVTSRYLLEPKDSVEYIRSTYEDSKEEFKNYISKNFDRNNELNFVKNPDMLVIWAAMQSHAYHLNSATEVEINNLRNLSLSFSDLCAASEAKLKRRIHFASGKDAIYTSKLGIKPDSSLRKRFNNFNEDEQQQANALCELRAALLQIEQAPFAVLSFSIAVLSLLLGEKGVLLRSSQILAEETARLFGPYFSKSLAVKENDPVDKKAWLIWLNNKLKGRNKEEDKKAIMEFNKLVKSATTKIIDEHFVRDLNEVSPGFADTEVDFKEWTDPLAL